MITVSDLAIKTGCVCLFFAASALLTGCDISPEKHNSQIISPIQKTEAVHAVNDVPRIFGVTPSSMELDADDR